MCGNRDSVSENSLQAYLRNNPLSKVCGVCNGKKVKEGINDIPTTAPWMIDYFQGKYDEARKYTKSSNKRKHFVCPHCLKIKNNSIQIRQLQIKRSIGCSCGDGVTYAEKVMKSCLEQLELEYIQEYSPEWIKPKRYDFYLPSKNVIIEMDGALGHGNGNKINKTTRQETQATDDYKDKMALKNNLKVIRVNCLKSDIDFIKDNIIQSRIFTVKELQKIDFRLCEETALSNRAKDVCDYYNRNKPISSTDIGTIFHIAHSTVLNYLNKGTKIGWCNYNGKENMKLAGVRSGQNTAKAITVFLNGEKLKEYSSCVELERNSEKDFGVKLFGTCAIAVARGKRMLYKGYTFAYTEKLCRSDNEKK